jgi:hypothetical protein
MKRPDKRVLQALCNLEDNPDFTVIREWFLESAADQDELLRSAESATVVYRAQGASKELLEFVDVTANARDIATKSAMQEAGIHPFPV